MALVADYSSSGESEESSAEDNNCKSNTKQSGPGSSKDTLPSAAALFATNTKAGSVFQNAFVEERNAEKTRLEKHVKMVDRNNLGNGRKICWNYRKGRCRFGSKCQFVHDSDLIVDTEIQEPKKININETKCDIHMPHDDDVDANLDLDKEGVTNKKAKRPGLTDSLVPSKRVMKSYNQQK